MVRKRSLPPFFKREPDANPGLCPQLYNPVNFRNLKPLSFKDEKARNWGESEDLP